MLAHFVRDLPEDRSDEQVVEDEGRCEDFLAAQGVANGLKISLFGREGVGGEGRDCRGGRDRGLGRAGASRSSSVES